MMWILFFSSLHLFAESPKYNKLLLLPEESQWLVVGLDHRKNSLPEKIFSHAFTTQSQAESYAQDLQQGRDVDLLSPPLAPSDVKFFTENKTEVVWKAQNKWDWNWEIRYGQWVTQNVDADFFQKHGLATDCADVAVISRWIFARAHYLPMGNTLPGTQILFTNESMKSSWVSLTTDPDWKKDQRFLTALNYVADNTYTVSLLEDSYPIAIGPQTLLPGTHHLTVYGTGGHTFFVHRTNTRGSDVPVNVIYSTIPREVRPLFEGPFNWEELPTKSSGGFLKIRWLDGAGAAPELVKSEDMPHYSLEQFDPSFRGEGGFALTVQRKINPGFSPRTMLVAQLDEISTLILARKQVVEEGFLECQKQDCEPGTSAFDTWSTPSRDHRIRDNLRQAQIAVHHLSSLDPSLSTVWSEGLDGTVIDLFGSPILLKQIRFLFEAEVPSWDPRDSVEDRWRTSAHSLAIWMNRELNALFEKRRVQMLTSTCHTAGNCEQGGPQWTIEQTFPLDDAIKKFVFISKYFDVYFPEAKLGEELGKQKVIIDQVPTPLDQALKQIPWMNSNPRVHPESRWGREHPIFYGLQPQESYEHLTPGGWLIINGLSRKALKLENHGLIERPLPVGTGWVFRGDHGLALDASAGEIVIFDLNSGSKITEKVSLSPGTEYGLKWINSNYFLLEDVTSYSFSKPKLFQIKGGRIHPSRIFLDEKEFKGVFQNGDLALLTQGPNSLLFFDGAKIKTLPISLKGGADIIPVTLSQSHVVTRSIPEGCGFSCEDAQLTSIDLKTLKQSPMGTFNNPSFITSHLALVQSGPPSEVIEFEPSYKNYKTLYTLPENLICAEDSNLPLGVNEGCRHFGEIGPNWSHFLSCHKISEKGLESYRPRGGEIIQQCIGDWILTSLNNKSRVKDYKEQVHMSDDYIFIDRPPWSISQSTLQFLSGHKLGDGTYSAELSLGPGDAPFFTGSILSYSLMSPFLNPNEDLFFGRCEDSCQRRVGGPVTTWSNRPKVVPLTFPLKEHILIF